MADEMFRNSVYDQLDKMIELSDELYIVDVEKDELFELYLESFPEGLNPMYRERTVNDCSSCKNFIRDVGHVVAIIDGKVVTIWDTLVGNGHQPVADALADRVKNRSIVGVYRHRQRVLGSPPHREELDNGIINIYEHFHYKLPRRFTSNSIASTRARFKSNKDVLERGLEELSIESGELVLELIEENQLYRGQEFKFMVKLFIETKREYDKIEKHEKNMFLWQTSVRLEGGSKFRNTVIGTLLQDLSDGTPLEDAVASYESKVAPTNYKRPKALVTQAMIDRAEKKVEELGIEKSLERRYANIKDITPNNVLFASEGSKKKMKKSKSGIFADIEPTKPSYDPDKMDGISLEEFMNNVLPNANRIEVLMENKHENNLMSVIAPKNERSPNIMKWSNPFSWTYNGEVTDSIKERVRKAGGSVSGYMRFSLSWDYRDDLDLHVIEPDGVHIFYANKRPHNGAGWLDVDMNVNGESRNPVENITFENKHDIKQGKYSVYVRNFTKRNMEASGFQVEMEINGRSKVFTYDKPVRQSESVTVIEFEIRDGDLFESTVELPLNTTSKEIWGVTTHEWVPVSVIIPSPNHWNGERIGNKHWFFILEDCENPNKARGFYNEFLMDDLRDHRKVFELLSSKMKAEHTDKQLSGLGFSETMENNILVKVIGDKYERVVNVKFAPNMSTRFDKPEIAIDPVTIGTCEVCKQDVTNTDSRIPCPNECELVFHTAHFLESVRVSGFCPVCKVRISQPQIYELVKLPTV